MGVEYDKYRLEKSILRQKIELLNAEHYNIQIQIKSLLDRQVEILGTAKNHWDEIQILAEEYDEYCIDNKLYDKIENK